MFNGTMHILYFISWICLKALTTSLFNSDLYYFVNMFVNSKFGFKHNFDMLADF